MDALVKLYDLPISKFDKDNIIVRRVMAYEKTQLLSWVNSQFGSSWSDECSVAFSNQPVSCLVAINNGSIVGFACYDCTLKNYFGPIGITEDFRNLGIGSHLLITCLNVMKNNGYAYAIIGGCDEQLDFYLKSVGAIPIEGSTPGIYSNRINS